MEAKRNQVLVQHFALGSLFYSYGQLQISDRNQSFRH
jgi:hypothetical protein